MYTTELSDADAVLGKCCAYCHTYFGAVSIRFFIYTPWYDGRPEILLCLNATVTVLSGVDAVSGNTSCLLPPYSQSTHFRVVIYTRLYDDPSVSLAFPMLWVAGLCCVQWNQCCFYIADCDRTSIRTLS